MQTAFRPGREERLLPIGTLKRGEITSPSAACLLSFSELFAGEKRCSLRFRHARCPHRASAGHCRVGGAAGDPWSRDPCTEFVFPYKPVSDFSQEQILGGLVKPRAVLPPARTRFVGPISKAATRFTQENVMGVVVQSGRNSPLALRHS